MFAVGQKVIIDAMPGQLPSKHGEVGVILDGPHHEIPHESVGIYRVEFGQDGFGYGFLPTELMPFTDRLEYLRGEIDAERISTGELIELQGYADHIDRDDVQLLEWAGVPEFPEE